MESPALFERSLHESRFAAVIILPRYKKLAL